MKAVVYERYGSPDVLLKENEVLIHACATSVSAVGPHTISREAISLPISRQAKAN